MDRPERPAEAEPEELDRTAPTRMPGADPDPPGHDRTAATYLPDADGELHAEETERIGPYHLREILGQGGMGSVYLAEQREPIRRLVALKIIKLGMDTRHVIKRFDSERQALAIMDHPHVAKVLDAGITERGRPYFVMEHVPGKPITDYCDEAHLTIRQRLDLFVRVCDAIQHAHQKGLIHRDIKPSNVLVWDQDGKPVPKVIDFGIAKATGQSLTDATQLTEAGVLVGTPSYMSPEQAEGSADIDTRTDVYSLGVLLYEMLIGVRPLGSLKQLSLEQVRRKIIEEDPPRPSTLIGTRADGQTARNRQTDATSLRRQLSGDLDWILMKSLEKDRNRRYPSVNGLAMDIQRYLDNEPVVARPPSTRYRVSKFVRRNKGAVLAGSAVLVALLLGLTLATAGFVQARRERDRAVAAEALARREADKATATNQFLTDMLSSAKPSKAQGREITVRELLDEASTTVGESFGDAPEVEADVRYTIGAAYDSLGLFDSAEGHLVRALDIRRELLGEHHTDTASAMNQLAMLHFHRDEFERAEELWLRELEILRASEGDSHPLVLNALQNLGAAYLGLKSYDKAEPLLEQAVEGRRRVLGEEHPQTMASIANLALLYDLQKNHAAAEPLLTKVVEWRRSTLGDSHPRTLISIYNLGMNRQDQGRLAEADELYVLAGSGFRRVQGEDHPYTLAVMKSRAKLLLAMQRFEEAESAALECYERLAARFGAEHHKTREVAGVLVAVYEALDDPAQSERWRARAPAEPR